MIILSEDGVIKGRTFNRETRFADSELSKINKVAIADYNSTRL